MEILIKSTVAAIFGALFCLVIKKQNPEIAFSLSALITVSVLLSLSSSLSSVFELINGAMDMLPESRVLIKPMIKCMAIGFIGKFASDICKDFSQLALSSALQFGSTVCAAAVAAPILLSTFRMIGSLV